jgi:pimeloyl-ACP methyl ester carboxylesterase
VIELRQTHAVATAGHWFGPAQRPLLGWLSSPVSALGETGVLILPPIGYAYWSSHRTLRVLAERLAGQGHTVLRFDYDGSGDSAGEQTDGERLSSWRASAAAAAAELRELGAGRLVLVGMRLGGAIALLDGAALGADAVVAWEPVVSGSRYTREIRLLATAVPDSVGLPAGTLLAGGCVYLPQTLDELAALGPQTLEAAPASRVLLVSTAQTTELVERLELLGAAVTSSSAAGSETALELPAEYATVPEGPVAAISDWLDGGATVARPPAPARASTRLSATLREEVITLGAERFVAIQTEPPSLAADAPTLVLLNTGSEPHIGPGRAWVEFARALAADGNRCVRVDFRGWGESPDDGLAPGRPYDAHCIGDTVAIVRALREREPASPIVLAGLCASAWVALRTVLREPVAGVVALNPQLYWQPGDPVEATMAETRLRRTQERGREARGGRWGIWSALDLLGSRPWAARWLDELAATGVPTTLAFAQGDDGIEYLRNRLSRRLSRVLRKGSLSVVEIPAIDHSMGRVWLRESVIEVIRQRLREAGAAVASPAAQPTGSR